MLLIEHELATSAVAEVTASASSRPALGRVAAAAAELVHEAGFVVLRGLPVSGREAEVLHAIAGELGSPYVDPTIGSFSILAEVAIGQALMGNQPRRLPPHTDYSMLPTPPAATLSCCIAPDPLPGAGAIRVYDLDEAWYGLENSDEFRLIATTPMPLCGGDVLTQVPLMSRQGEGLIVRYHPSRLATGFRRVGGPDDRQLRALRLFLDRLPAAHTLVLERGDVLVIDNHRCLHSRGACSIAIGAEGTSGRRMTFGFLEYFNAHDDPPESPPSRDVSPEDPQR